VARYKAGTCFILSPRSTLRRSFCTSGSALTCKGLFNQAMLNQNAMIRRYCQRRWMGRRSALALFWVFHCTMLTRFLNAVISLALMRYLKTLQEIHALRFCTVFGNVCS
jgi:uncharacterized protein VirK/YbjX